MSCICDLRLHPGVDLQGQGQEDPRSDALLFAGPELELSSSRLVGFFPLTCLSLLAPQGPHPSLAPSLMDPPQWARGAH